MGALCKQLCWGLGFSISVALPVAAETGALIDVQLEKQLDFRDQSFSVCFGKERCTVGGVKISAYRKMSALTEWEPAKVYWDPIDGLGILSGGQDDEIDFNERLDVRFDTPQRVERVWLSDLFSSETPRYLKSIQPDTDIQPEAGAQAEIADVTFLMDGAEPVQFRVSGERNLPEAPFNLVVDSELFDEGSDIRQRLVVDGEDLYLLNNTDVQSALSDEKKLNSDYYRLLPYLYEAEKAEVFCVEETCPEEFDLLAAYSTPLYSDLVEDEKRNVVRMATVLDQVDRLTGLENRSKLERQYSEIPNGEVAGIPASPVLTESIVFTATVGTSNDFSVAGLVMENVSP